MPRQYQRLLVEEEAGVYPNLQQCLQLSLKGPPVGRGRGRGAANVVAKKTRQPNIAQAAPAPLQPSAPPLSSLPQSQESY